MTEGRQRHEFFESTIVHDQCWLGRRGIGLRTWETSRSPPREGDGRADAPPDLQSLVVPERRKVLESMRREDIPGAAVCLIHEGKAWIEGFGVTDRGSNRRVSTDTIFSIQATSKNFNGNIACRTARASRPRPADFSLPIGLHGPKPFRAGAATEDDVAASAQSPCGFHA